MENNSPSLLKSVFELDKKRFDGKIVIIESPFSAFTPDGKPDDDGMNEKIRYAQLCMAYVGKCGGIPIVPHLLYTQHHECPTHFVHDADCEPGKKYDVGVGRDYALKKIETLRRIPGALTLFCTAMNVSNGMKCGLEDCKENNLNWSTLPLKKDFMKAIISPKKLKIYVAGAWKGKSYVEHKAKILEDLGTKITHKWYETENDMSDEQKLKEYAKDDMNGVLQADLVVVIMDSVMPDEKSETMYNFDYRYHGSTTEIGIALGSGKDVCIFNPFLKRVDAYGNNIFTRLAVTFTDWEQLKNYVKDKMLNMSTKLLV